MNHKLKILYHVKEQLSCFEQALTMWEFIILVFFNLSFSYCFLFVKFRLSCVIKLISFLIDHFHGNVFHGNLTTGRDCIRNIPFTGKQKLVFHDTLTYSNRGRIIFRCVQKFDSNWQQQQRRLTGDPAPFLCWESTLLFWVIYNSCFILLICHN